MNRFFLALVIFGILTVGPAAWGDTDLRVLTYNIHHGRGVDGEMGLERIAKLIESANPDVVALQEVDQACQRSGTIDQVAWFAERLGMDGRFGKFMDFQGGEYGLAILSKLPVKESVVHKLPVGGEPRMALEVVVETAAGLVSVVGLHFDWVSDDTNRYAQAEKLVEGLAGRERPVVLAGDFNDVPGSRTLELFVKSGWKDAPKSGGATATFPSENPRVEIDFVMVRGGEPDKATVIDERVASDHRPVVADITLPPASPE
ncbi:endonuclease/exonuclease/phosphatase family protein [soil metagenome]